MSVVLDGGLRDGEAVGNFLVRQALPQQRIDLLFPSGEHEGAIVVRRFARPARGAAKQLRRNVRGTQQLAGRRPANGLDKFCKRSVRGDKPIGARFGVLASEWAG